MGKTVQILSILHYHFEWNFWAAISILPWTDFNTYGIKIENQILRWLILLRWCFHCHQYFLFRIPELWFNQKSMWSFSNGWSWHFWNATAVRRSHDLKWMNCSTFLTPCSGTGSHACVRRDCWTFWAYLMAWGICHVRWNFMICLFFSTN